MTESGLLTLPGQTLEAIAERVRQQAGDSGGALHALRGTCRLLRSIANACTRSLAVPRGAEPEELLDSCTRFPAVTTIRIDGYCPAERLAACLAALPDGCWAAVEDLYTHGHLTTPAAAHAGRLCPRLRQIAITCRPGDGNSLAGALEGLGAVAGTLETLGLSLDPGCCGPGAEQLAAAALGRLVGLRRLRVDWGVNGPPDAEGLLVAALPSLTALSSLDVSYFNSRPTQSPLLGVAPESLRELSLCDRLGTWVLAALEAAPQLGGVTRLTLNGGRRVMGQVFAKLPSLRELVLYDPDLNHPAATLAHLTRLKIHGGYTGSIRLAAAAPWLKVLSWRGESVAMGGGAVMGHACLRDLDLEFRSLTTELLPDEEWLSAARQLTAVTRLAVVVDAYRIDDWDDDEESEEEELWPDDRLLHVCRWLSRFEGLQHLELSFVDAAGAVTLQQVLAAVGAAAGGRLRSLTLDGAPLPRARADAERAVAVLAGCYHQLESLGLRLFEPWGMEASAAQAASRDLIQAVPAAAALCPALREVWLGPTKHSSAVSWLRPAGV